MSLAGAQHTLLVVYDGDRLHEPVGATPSTHILKPDHRDRNAYPSSVINEYAMMTLAASLGLDVPRVYRRYCPEPVYIVERFDRVVHGALPEQADRAERQQLIDACQLLNKDQLFKYSAASLDTLGSVIASCRSKSPTRLPLFRWLAFNLLIGNNDNHIKNISFLVDEEGVRLAPFYDLLSTACYHTRASAGGGPSWPMVDLAIALPGQPRFGDVTRAGLLEAGAAVGLPLRICSRELDAMLRGIEAHLDRLIEQIAQENERLPEPCRPFLGGEMKLLRTIRHVVVADMVEKLKGWAWWCGRTARPTADERACRSPVEGWRSHLGSFDPPCRTAPRWPRRSGQTGCSAGAKTGRNFFAHPLQAVDDAFERGEIKPNALPCGNPRFSNQCLKHAVASSS